MSGFKDLEARRPDVEAGSLRNGERTGPVYPEARRGAQKDVYFGIEVADPYRWMEDVDAAEVTAWIEAENALTRGILDGVGGRAGMEARLTALMDFERFSVPVRKGERTFYSHNSGLQNQPVVYWQEVPGGEARVLLDPNQMSADGTVALSGMSVSEDGTRVAYAIADAGSDWVRWKVREVGTGQDLEDEVRWSKFSSAAWLKDGSGFFYEGYGLEAAAVGESLKAENLGHRVFLHRLGTGQEEDAVVYARPDDPELNVGAAVTEDGRYLLLFASKGTSPNNELAVLDLSVPGAEVRVLVGTADATYSPIGNEGTRMWVQTTLAAPNGRVVAMDLTDERLGTEAFRESWRETVAESRNKLEGVSLVGGMLIAQYLEDAQSVVEFFSVEGVGRGRLELPAIGTVDGFDGRREDSETYFRFANVTTPGTIYRLDLDAVRRGERGWTVYRQPQLKFDPEAFETRQVFYASKDGTRVPMFVTAKRGLVRDGSAAALLYGYGGFNISLGPEFSAANVLWLEMGGVYAQPSLRGGGEYGEAWHEAGMRLNKQNVFDDFCGAAEWLIREGYTASERLAIYGGSNGGLLVAACAQQRPELFGAGMAAVGVMDMLRFDQFTIGWAWKAEYGSPREVEAEFRELLRYSPLHTVERGRRYPAMLILTADHDDRVFPAHSFKYAAAMQAAAEGVEDRRPVLLRVETRAGHGAGMPLSKRVAMTVDQYAFLVRELEVRMTLA